jgi:hypothetical protein
MSTFEMIVVVVFAEGLLHYFPWRKILKGKDLPRVAAYALGVLGLMVPFTVWLLGKGERDIALTLWLAIVAGGTMVLALYGLDHVIDLEWKVREGTERETQLKEQVGGKGK